MSKTFKLVDGDISDGYHTFGELYEHRNLLFLNLCLNDASNCYWKQDYEEWFCLFWESPFGQISYHLPNSMLSFVKAHFTRDEEHKWDGHTSVDVMARLAKNLTEDRVLKNNSFYCQKCNQLITGSEIYYMKHAENCGVR